MSLSVLIPMYNEIEQLKHTIKKLYKIKKKIKNFEIIFIDDFSNDGSIDYVRRYSKKNSFIKVFKNKKKGLGSAIEEGIKKSKSDYICVFMCDMSDDVNDLVKYFKMIKKSKKDAIFGSRFIEGSKVKNYPLFKLLLNRVSNNLIKLIQN